MRLLELHKLIKEEAVEKHILRQVSNNNVKLELYDQGDYLELDKIIVPAGQRGVGIGSEILTKIGKYADKEGKSVYLTPSRSYGGTSLRRLMTFYKRFGFKMNDDKSFNGSMMIREPQ